MYEIYDKFICNNIIIFRTLLVHIIAYIEVNVPGLLKLILTEAYWESLTITMLHLISEQLKTYIWHQFCHLMRSVIE